MFEKSNYLNFKLGYLWLHLAYGCGLHLYGKLLTYIFIWYMCMDSIWIISLSLDGISKIKLF